MKISRTLDVLRLDLAEHLRRPMLWVLIVILGLLAWMLAGGDATINSGDTSVGGERAWITSQFANAYVMSFTVFAFYSFFIAVLAGLAVIRDDELKVGEILHTTPMSAAEYVWGKFLAVVAAFAGVLTIHLLATAVCNHLLPDSEHADITGPFVLANYLVPAVVFALPVIVFMAGVSFAVGERSRRPLLVFVLPLAAVLFAVMFLWEWSPGWLDPRWNRLLMLLDPSGFRWLNETWLKVDRGVAFYNTAPIGFDLGFGFSRVLMVVAGLGAVLWSQRGLEARLRGAVSGRRQRSLAAAAGPAGESNGSGRSQLATGPLAGLAMTMRAPGLFRGAREIARVELRELAASPGLYLFVPIILLQAFGNMVTSGAVDAPVLFTSGLAAARMVNTLTLLVCLLLAFYTVESLWRDRATGFGALASALPVPSAAVLLGKSLANSLVGVVILLAAFATSVVVMLVEGQAPIRLMPFVVVWGGLLVPTFIAWTAFVAAVFALTRSRYTTYAVAIAAFLATAVFMMRGDMNWVGNWQLWGAVRWTDMGPLALDREALILNRVMVLGLAVLFVALAVRFFPRRENDAARTVMRLQPRALLRGTLGLLPFAVVPLVAGTTLYVMVDHGREGGASEKQAKDYWRQNLATWRDAPLPDLSAVELDLELDPATSEFSVSGSYELVNGRAESLARFPITTGHHWRDVTWTLDGAAYEPEDRTGLYVIEPEEGLAPGGSVRLGFSYQGRLPDGISKNGGELSEFILPCGVVLTSFSPSVAPVLGFMEEIGVDEDNTYEPKVYPPDFWRGETMPLYGSASAFTTRIRVTLPEAYRANSVGVLVSDAVDGGQRSQLWLSDVPVRFFNVVAGRWAERKGDNTVVYYHPEHSYNIDEISAALDGARKYFSEWFYPYPWRELKLSEFADLDRYAQGFPTNITFSEGIGFLTKDDPRSNAAFAITAHEAAHQWWGNILTPGKGPGGNLLAEGLSHFSAAMLVEELRGPLRAAEFRKRIEDSYGDSRRADAERPMVEVDGSKAGDTTVMYDKGGWVFWMLADLVGRDNAFAGLNELVVTTKDGPDFPVLQDFVAVMRSHAPDLEAFDAFVDQWFYRVEVPELRFTEVKLVEPTDAGDPWTVRATLRNDGSGRVTVEVAAASGDRMDDEGQPLADYRDARTTVALGPGEERALEISCDFEPDRVLPDPDVRVLQLNRDKAMRRL